MLPLRRVSLALAALSLVAACPPQTVSAGLALDPAPAWRHAGSLPDLVAVLEDWLDAHGPYPRRNDPPRIEIIAREVAEAQLGMGARMGQKTRGLYDAESGTIYLIGPWSPDSAPDVSVLLHELVHHRQHTARHWYCPGQQEPDAYRLQAEWLAERGRRLAVNRIAIVLEAGCTRRDMHPD